jgi:hypothetical protein
MPGRRWETEAHLSSGLLFVKFFYLHDIREAIREARLNGVERAALPPENWIMDLLVEEISHYFPNLRIVKASISEQV